MSSHDDLKRKLADAGLPAVAQSITQLARPCYRVVRALTPEEEIPLGASKFGGSPDVPADFVWPQTPDATKSEPMEFVGQVRLADLPGPLPEPAPQSGLLSFFTRWSGGRVFYFPEGTLLERTPGPYAPIEPAPSGLWQTLRSGLKHKANPRHTYRAASLKFDPGLSPPDGTSSMIEELNLSEADSEAYIELCEEWWTSGAGEDPVQHKMFGHAHTVQNEMELGCDFRRRGEKERWDLPGKGTSLPRVIGFFCCRWIPTTVKAVRDGCGATLGRSTSGSIAKISRPALSSARSPSSNATRIRVPRNAARRGLQSLRKLPACVCCSQVAL